MGREVGHLKTPTAAELKLSIDDVFGKDSEVDDEADIINSDTSNKNIDSNVTNKRNRKRRKLMNASVLGDVRKLEKPTPKSTLNLFIPFDYLAALKEPETNVHCYL